MPGDQDAPATKTSTDSASGPAAAGVAPPPVIPTLDHKAAVVVGGGSIPTDVGLVIVTESRTYAKDAETGTFDATLKTTGYSPGADIYYRTDEAVSFPTDAKLVLTLGVDIEQGMFWGFSKNPSAVNVGPAHPAFAGANLAYQRGARQITIYGLSELEKGWLLPYFNALPADKVMPAADVEIALA